MQWSMRQYLELGSTLTWREIVVRYKRSSLGIVWALVDPAVHVAIYFFVFGVVLDAGRGVDNYALFTMLGVLPWVFLSMTIEQGASVLFEHGALVRKIPFPHELLVFAVVISRMTTLLIGIGLVLPLAFIVADVAWSRLPLLALGLLLLTSLTTGLALVASVAHTVFGDAGFIVRFALRLGFYACPIVYPLSRVPDAVRPWYELNPIVGVLWCFQAVADRDLAPPSITGVVSAATFPLVVGVAGWWAFRRLRGTVAELV